MQPAAADAMLNFPRVEAEPQQLPPRHNPMLPPGQFPGPPAALSLRVSDIDHT
jgi:hypothetical protein